MIEAERTDLLFHALADATRRDIIRLALQGEHSVSDVRKDPTALTMIVTSERAAPATADLASSSRRWTVERGGPAHHLLPSETDSISVW